MSESKGERSAAAIGSPEKDGNKWDAKDDAYLDTDSLMQVAESKTDGSYVAPSGMKHDAKVEEPLSDEEILARLQQFFFEDPNFGSSLESFVRDNCSIVDLSTEEFQLQYTAVFEDYKRLFEAQMESFIERDLKVSIQEVYRALKAANDQAADRPDSLDAFFAQVLIASTDFEVFVSMMRDMARQRAHK